ncbi:uncharacterized protein [Patagioenas fasciata]|uniref:uncharacterized protein n=1 Tax=Patagioenas fasciata TaxID=372321 RepID=UPI003A98F1F3
MVRGPAAPRRGRHTVRGVRAAGIPAPRPYLWGRPRPSGHVRGRATPSGGAVRWLRALRERLQLTVPLRYLPAVLPPSKPAPSLRRARGVPLAGAILRGGGGRRPAALRRPSRRGRRPGLEGRGGNGSSRRTGKCLPSQPLAARKERGLGLLRQLRSEDRAPWERVCLVRRGDYPMAAPASSHPWLLGFAGAREGRSGQDSRQGSNGEPSWQAGRGTEPEAQAGQHHPGCLQGRVAAGTWGSRGKERSCRQHNPKFALK